MSTRLTVVLCFVGLVAATLAADPVPLVLVKPNPACMLRPASDPTKTCKLAVKDAPCDTGVKPMDAAGTGCALGSGCWNRDLSLADCDPKVVKADCALLLETETEKKTCTMVADDTNKGTVGCLYRYTSWRPCFDFKTESCSTLDEKGAACTLETGCGMRHPKHLGPCKKIGVDCEFLDDKGTTCEPVPGCGLRLESGVDCTAVKTDPPICGPLEYKNDAFVKCTLDDQCIFRTPNRAACDPTVDVSGLCTLQTATSAADAATCTITPGCLYRKNSFMPCDPKGTDPAPGPDCKLRNEDGYENCIPGKGCWLRTKSLAECGKGDKECSNRDEKGDTCKPQAGCFFRKRGDAKAADATAKTPAYIPSNKDCETFEAGKCDLTGPLGTVCTLKDDEKLCAYKKLSGQPCSDLADPLCRPRTFDGTKAPVDCEIDTVYKPPGCFKKTDSGMPCLTPPVNPTLCATRGNDLKPCMLEPGCFYRNVALQECPKTPDTGTCKKVSLRDEKGLFCQLHKGCALRGKSGKKCPGPSPDCALKDEKDATCDPNKGVPPGATCWYRDASVMDCDMPPAPATTTTTTTTTTATAAPTCTPKLKDGHPCTNIDPGCRFRMKSLKPCAKTDPGCAMLDEKAKPCQPKPGCFLRDASMVDCNKGATGCSPKNEKGATCTPPPGCQARDKGGRPCTPPAGGAALPDTCSMRDGAGDTCKPPTGCKLRSPQLATCTKKGPTCQYKSEAGATCKQPVAGNPIGNSVCTGGRNLEHGRPKGCFKNSDCRGGGVCDPNTTLKSHMPKVGGRQMGVCCK